MVHPNTLRISAAIPCWAWIALLLGAHSATAEMRAYDMATAGGGDAIRRAPELTPSVGPSFQPPTKLGIGRFFLEDDGGGSVTAHAIRFEVTGAETIVSTGFMGAPPGAYTYFRTRVRVAGSGIASGSTAPNGQTDWGVVTGWASSGGEFCRSTPPFICTFANHLEDGTTASPFLLTSSSYDLGTWNFDANGDFEATPYIAATAPISPGFPSFPEGDSSNVVYTLRGRFFGASLPALPAVGFGGLAVALAVVATRSLRRGR